MQKLTKITATVLATLMLVGCTGNKPTPTPSPTSIPTAPPTAAPAVTSTPTPALNFTYDDTVDFATILPELATHAVQFEGEDKALFLTSTLTLDPTTIVDTLRLTQFGKDLIYKQTLHEFGDGINPMRLESTQFEKQIGSITIDGFKPNALHDYDSTCQITASYRPNKVTGVEDIYVKMDMTDIPNADAMQKQAEEFLIPIFGTQLAHALVYAPPTPDSEWGFNDENYYSITIDGKDENGEINSYRFVRSSHIEEDEKYLTYRVAVGTSARNRNLYLTEDYQSLATDIPAEIVGLFEGRLGEEFSIVQSRNSFDKILRTGENEKYLASFLYRYTYDKKYLFSGGTKYRISFDFRKTADELHPLTATCFGGDFEITYDANGKMTECEYTVSGVTDQTGVRMLDDASQMEAYERCLPQLKEQIRMAFDDGVILDELTLAECEQERDVNDRIVGLTYGMPASLNEFGKTHSGTIKIWFSLNGVTDMAYGAWSFSHRWQDSIPD